MEREHHNLEHHGGADPIGTIVAERYRLLDCLGQGGSGITYAAEDLQTNQRVALKALLLRHMDDWKQLELFEREANILKQLKHPAIPKYLDYFEVDTERDRAFYIAQELAEGKPLATKVAEGWRTTEQGVRKIAEQVLEILSYLHRLDPPVIHRDIKPQNLILSDSGKLSLVDFGAVQDTYRSTMVKGSTVIGTYGYMAPEQFRGQAVPASDLYGLGATLLFLLTHRAPSDLPQERLRINFRKRVQISPAFADWLEKLLEPDVDDRFPSAPAALTALRTKVLTSKPTRPLSPPVVAGIALASLVMLPLLFTFRYPVLGIVGIHPRLEHICAANLKDIERYIDSYGSKAHLLKCWGEAPNPEAFTKILNLLLEKGVGLKSTVSFSMGSYGSSKQSTLSLALAQGDLETAGILVKRWKHDVNSKDFLGFTLLMVVAAKGNTTLVKQVLDKGADVNAKTSYRHTPLLQAIQYGRVDIAKLLISKGADINTPDSQGNTPLLQAVQSGQIDLAKLLISKSANISTPNSQGNTPLLQAVQSRQIDLAKLLISKGADVNARASYGGTILTQAIQSGDKDLAELLISKGAGVNAQDTDGRTLLIQAIQYRHVDIAKLLISHGANVNIRDNLSGVTPLIQAIQSGDKDLAKLLISKGANINDPDSLNGYTPLSWAISFGQEDIARLLISKGAKE